MELNDLMPFKKRPEVSFINNEINGIETTTVCYMIQNNELWTLPNSLELRGHCFNSNTGEMLCAAFPKFFRYLENLNSTLTDNELKESLVLEKKDGSLIMPVIIGDKIHMKSKKSFNNLHCSVANKLVLENKHLSDFIFYCQNIGYTPLFELTFPDGEIVINYGEMPNLTLLAMRKISDLSYYDFKSLKSLAFNYGIGVVKEFKFASIVDILQACEQLTDFEGFVVVTKSNKCLKFKTSWYDSLHRIKTCLRERDFIEFYLDNKTDEVYSVANSYGLNVSILNDLESNVSSKISEILSNVNEIILLDGGLDRKDFALKYKDNSLFGLLMSAYLKRDIKADTIKYFKKHCLPLYSLRTIFSNFGGSYEMATDQGEL